MKAQAHEKRKDSNKQSGRHHQKLVWSQAMKFDPVQHPPSCAPFFQDAVAGNVWEPLYSHPCTFGPAMFVEKMMNLVENPNLNSTWLFRADILYDSQDEHDARGNGNENGSEIENGNEDRTDEKGQFDSRPIVISHQIQGMTCYRSLVRRLVPRNEKRDRPLDQTCSFYKLESSPDSDDKDNQPSSTIVIYSPHSPSAADLPFYHPKVRGIAHLHQWNKSTDSGTISIHFLPFPDLSTDARLQRTAYHLLETLSKHGHAQDYVKRVHHDVVVPRQRFQDRYALLKSKYARRLVETWAENTDPTKHVFEDLGIAAFLIELWTDMYPKNEGTTASACDGGGGFPGFVDMACGNGLLVYILNQEGYPGWGFDARRRKSWAQYGQSSSSSSSSSSAAAAAASNGGSLQELLLLPDLVKSSASEEEQREIQLCPNIHNGVFPPGTFLISNHGDELTPWTPILAASSHCPFIMIPCCSHNLTGEKFRAPPPQDKSKPKSAYASLVEWVTRIAEDCGWDVETEMLRIPSTRNTCLLGRTRRKIRGIGDVADGIEGDAASNWDASAIVEKYGGVKGYFEAVSKLVKSVPRSH